LDRSRKASGKESCAVSSAQASDLKSHWPPIMMCTGPCSAPLSAKTMSPTHDDDVSHDANEAHVGNVV